MKAVVITKFGDVDGLQVREVEKPANPTADRVLVRVRAAGLNRADILQRKGHYPAPSGYPPDIPGIEFAGSVEAIGPEVRTWKIGQRVFGITGGGAQAEYLVTPENQLAEIPLNLDWTRAAAVPEVFITAHDALFVRAGLQSGENVLVHAAGSGVGTAAIQLARAAGASVFGTSRNAEKLARARRYGLNRSVVAAADPVIIAESIHGWTGGKGVDVVLDLVGAAYLEANLKSLATLGRMVLVGTTSGSKAPLDFSLAMSKRVTIVGTVLRSRAPEEKAAATHAFATHVLPLLASGLVEPVVDSTFKLEQVREAHLRLESNETFGKVVLLLD
jgi:putative PIG3 family NAD(P)H quinone oxidoreductase